MGEVAPDRPPTPQGGAPAGEPSPAASNPVLVLHALSTSAPAFSTTAEPGDTVADVRARLFAAWPPTDAAPPSSPDALRLISSGRLLADPAAPFLAAALPRALLPQSDAPPPSVITLHVVVRRPEQGGAGGKGKGGGASKKGGESEGCCGCFGF